MPQRRDMFYRFSDDPAWAAYQAGVGTPPFIGGPNPPRPFNPLEELFRRFAAAQQRMGTPLQLDFPSEEAPAAPPLFSTQAAALGAEAPRESPATYPPIQLSRPTPAAAAPRMTLGDLLGQARAAGGAMVPTPQTDYYHPQQSALGQAHPNLARMLEAAIRTGAGWDPTGATGIDYKFRAARQLGLENAQAAQMKTGVGVVDQLEKMRQAQTVEEQKARDLESLLTLQRAQTAAAQAREGFTLGPNQVRFGPEGTEIARGPAEAIAATRPNIQSTVRPDTQSKTGYAEYMVGLDPQTGEIAWEQKIGDAPKPSAGPREGISPIAESSLIMRLGDRWTALTKEVREMNRQATLMEAGMNAARRGDMAAGSQAVLVTFQKILDPTSVVRESEYARSASGQALLSRIEGAYERLARGGAGVPLKELEVFSRLAKDFVKGASQTEVLANEQRRLGMIADQYNIPKEFIFGPMPVTEQFQQTPFTPTERPSVMVTPDGKPHRLQRDGTYD